MISGNVAINRNIYPEATKVPLTIFFDWPRRKMTLSALSQKRTFAAQKGMFALHQKRPKSDPAGIRDLKDVAKAFKAIRPNLRSSFRGAIALAPISPNSGFGTRTSASISRRIKALGT